MNLFLGTIYKATSQLPILPNPFKIFNTFANHSNIWTLCTCVGRHCKLGKCAITFTTCGGASHDQAVLTTFPNLFCCHHPYLCLVVLSFSSLDIVIDL